MGGRCGEREKVWERWWEVDSQSLYSHSSQRATTGTPGHSLVISRE